MKNTSLITLSCAALLLGCSTTELNTAQAVVDPIAIALVSGYAQQYGVPPALTSAVLTPLVNDAWGMVAQANAGNNVAQGAAIPAVGTTVSAQNPTAAQLTTAITTLTKAKSNPALASTLLAAASAKTNP